MVYELDKQMEHLTHNSQILESWKDEVSRVYKNHLFIESYVLTFIFVYFIFPFSHPSFMHLSLLASRS